jgi:hypothetical protein
MLCIMSTQVLCGMLCTFRMCWQKTMALASLAAEQHCI